MRRYLSRIAAVATVCTLAFAILPINAADGPDRDQLVVIAYPVADLPVYQAQRGGKSEFNPDLLISLIRAKVDPDSWETQGTISPHNRTDTLVIRQTRANHRQISELLATFRTPNPREETETSSQNYDRVRTDVLNTIFRADRGRYNDMNKAVEHIDALIEKVESAGLTEEQGAHLLDVLRRTRERIVTGQNPKSESKEQGEVRRQGKSSRVHVAQRNAPSSSLTGR